METNGLENMTLEQLMSQYREKTARTRIMSFNEKLGYIEARKVAEVHGGLPRNTVHKQVLVDSDDWRSLAEKGYYPAWAREITVAPENGGVFRKGEDVVDGSIDEKGRKWIFPSYCIPEEARQKEGKGLFINPRKIIEEPKEVTIIADPSKDVVVLDDFLQESSWGKLDLATGVPLYTRNIDRASKDTGYFCRPSGSFVLPLVRGYVGSLGSFGYVYRRYVDAVCRHDRPFGVGVELRVVAPQNLESLTLGQLLTTLSKKKE